ncbi:MAG: CDP-alcohol phosphatidyltransferase family protein [Acidobacteriota bacterium]|nr:CDP-alcohol phosphatidyltransferase family protein [Acidobacteriota bacterium]
MLLRKAVIILSQRGQKKLLGLSLLKRIILNGSQAGIKEFWLFHPDLEQTKKTLMELSSDSRILDREIRLKILGPESSIQTLESSLDDDYLLLMDDDLVLSPDLLSRLEEKLVSIDQELVTIKISGKEGQQEHIPGFLAVKPGSRVESVLKLVVSGKTGSEIAAEADEEPAPVIISDSFAVKVIDRNSFKRAEKLLLQTGRKPQDGLIARVINRRVSLFLTRYILKTGISPSALTAMIFTVGVLSVFCVAYGRQLLVLGAFLFELASVIDGCDGENARLTYRMSKSGGAFDITADAVTFVSFFAAFPVGLYRTTGQNLWLYLGAFSLLSMLVFYLHLIFYARKTGLGHNIVAVVKEIEASRNNPEFQKPFDRLASKVAFVFRRDFFATAAFVLIVCGLARETMVAVAVGTFLQAVYFAGYSRRQLALKLNQADAKS